MTEGGIASGGPVEIHRIDDVLGIFDAAECRGDTGASNGVAEQSLVAVALALLIRCLTPDIQHGLKGRRVDQQPAFDVRVRDSAHNTKAGNAIGQPGDIAAPFCKAFAITVRSDNYQVGKSSSIPPYISEQRFEFVQDLTMPSGRTSPILYEGDAFLARYAGKNRGNDILVSSVLSETHDLNH